MVKNMIHDAVKSALIKNGWTIIADPFRIEYEESSLSADLAAERNGKKIVVEVKTFGGRSFVRQLQQANSSGNIVYRNYCLRLL